MTHLMLTSALLFALLAVVAIAIGASLGIAHDLMVDEASESAIDAQSVPAAGYAVRQQGPAVRQGLATGQVLATRQGHGLAEDFGLGLQHATHFAQDPGRSFSRNRSFHSRV
jgi:hypothetical protein